MISTERYCHRCQRRHTLTFRWRGRTRWWHAIGGDDVEEGRRG